MTGGGNTCRSCLVYSKFLFFLFLFFVLIGGLRCVEETGGVAHPISQDDERATLLGQGAAQNRQSFSGGVWPKSAKLVVETEHRIQDVSPALDRMYLCGDRNPPLPR